MEIGKAVRGFLLARSADGLSPHTLDDYGHTLRLFVEFVGEDAELGEIDTGGREQVGGRSDDLHADIHLQTRPHPQHPLRRHLPPDRLRDDGGGGYRVYLPLVLRDRR